MHLNWYVLVHENFHFDLSMILYYRYPPSAVLLLNFSCLMRFKQEQRQMLPIYSLLLKLIGTTGHSLILLISDLSNHNTGRSVLSDDLLHFLTF